MNPCNGDIVVPKAAPPPEGESPMPPEMEQPSDSAPRTIVLRGELTLPTGAALVETLREAFRGGTAVELDVSAVTDIDLCAMQALCSAHRTFVGQGRSLTLIGAPADFVSRGHDLGYARDFAVCPYRQGENCLWKF